LFQVKERSGPGYMLESCNVEQLVKDFRFEIWSLWLNLKGLLKMFWNMSCAFVLLQL